MIVIALGVALRVVISFVILAGMPQGGDGPSYSQQAQDVLAGTMSYWYFPPGTALSVVPFYWAFGPSVGTDHLVGVVLTSGFLVAAVFLSRVMLGWGRPTFIVAVLASLYPHSLLSSPQITSQPLAGICLAAAIAFGWECRDAWSWKRWVGASICIAALILTRPASAAVIGVFFIGGLILWRRRVISTKILLGATGIMVGMVVAFVAGFMVHNEKMGHGPVLSTNVEWNIFLSNNPFTPDYKTGHFGQRRFDEISPEARSYLAHVLPHESPYAATREQRRVMSDSARSYMISHPGTTLYRMSSRIRGFWGMDYTASRSIRNSHLISTAAFLVLLFLEGGGFLVVLLLAVTAPFILPNPMKGRWWLAMAVVALIMAPYIVAFAQTQYHLPLIPILMLFGAIVIDHCVREPRRIWVQVRSRWLWWACIATVFAIQAEHIYYMLLLL